jgi:thiamine-triphosphatase
MIEVEKKFILTEKQEKALIEGAEFLGEKKFTDIYYDDENFSLTTNDLWLRARDGRFELKIPMDRLAEKRITDQYRELETDSDILRYFKAEPNEILADFLPKKGYEPFCKLVTTRRKYKKDEFSIDLDSVDFGYTIAEVEYMVKSEEKLKEAEDNIMVFAKKHNIISAGVRYGKLIEYLKRNNPKHFQAIIDAKII